ncbi:MAG TPA: alpha/beta hydrolase domain-containing protein [Myxococcota bacterium]|nr:alpha/beta hydrolase domain-containing protein [Myxococcota bacterium]
MQISRSHTTCAAATALLLGLTSAGPAAADADSPTVTPATGGNGVPLVFGHFENVAAIGYQTTEFIVSGNAHSYATGAPLTPDGMWNSITADATTAPYTTRVVVHTPIKAKQFNGTVYVEWLNVSGLADASPDWQHGHIQVAREGAAYVMVSAQAAGVNQLKCAAAGGLCPAPGDPVRYASLSHPGDSYSYDIFSQAGQAIADGNVLGSLVPKRIIAMGESQSAGRLVTYVDAVHPLVDVYDGFVIHSRGAGGAALSQAPLANVPVPLAAIRTDLASPVIQFQSELDVANSRLLARQDETPSGKFRLWEVAGTAHFDQYGLVVGLTDTGNGQGEIDNLAFMQDPPSAPQPGLLECALGINTGPMHWVFNAAVHWINLWVRLGLAPPIAPRLEATTAPGVSPVVYASDDNGNTLGGIRTPYVDVPIAKLTGTGNGPAPGAPPISANCVLFGQTVPFTEEQLAALYPNHGTYVVRFFSAALQAVFSQYLLLPDALHLLQAAAQSDIAK